MITSGWITPNLNFISSEKQAGHIRLALTSSEIFYEFSKEINNYKLKRLLEYYKSEQKSQEEIYERLYYYEKLNHDNVVHKLNYWDYLEPQEIIYKKLFDSNFIKITCSDGIMYCSCKEYVFKNKYDYIKMLSEQLNLKAEYEPN